MSPALNSAQLLTPNIYMYLNVFVLTRKKHFTQIVQDIQFCSIVCHIFIALGFVFIAFIILKTKVIVEFWEHGHTATKSEMTGNTRGLMIKHAIKNI